MHEALRQDLWDRWRKAFDRRNEAIAPRGSTPRYSIAPAYSLREYSGGAVAAGAKVSKAPDDKGDNHVYQLDTADRPLHVAMTHLFNRVSWSGFYTYAEKEAEHIEYCENTGVPSLYERVTFLNGSPATFQSLRINTNGSLPAWKKDGKAAIPENPNNYQLLTEEYVVTDGSLQSSRVFTEGLGAPPMESVIEYTYDSDKRLQQKTQRWSTGEKHVLFAAKPKKAKREFIDELADKIASAVLSALAEIRSSEKIIAVEMSYRVGDSYLPALLPAMEKHRRDGFILATVIEPKDWIYLDAESLEAEIAQITTTENESKNAENGTRLLRKSAYLVTQAGRKQSKMSSDFIAFPIDWELEGHELPQILRECGATDQDLERWSDEGRL